MLIDAHAHLDKYTWDALGQVLDSLAEREILTVRDTVASNFAQLIAGDLHLARWASRLMG